MGLDSCNLKGKMKSCNIAGGNIYPTGPKGEQGKSLEFDWKGTSLGVRTEGQEEFVYKNLQGPQGKNGVANTLTIGKVQMGKNASATITGETPNQELNLVLPQGSQGTKGVQGKSLEFDWKGTSLGVRTEGQEEFVYKNLQGPKGENGVDALVTHKYQLKITSAVTAGTEVTIPCYYKVGQAVLDVYLNGERLLLSSDDAGTDGHYQEVGTANSISNKIKTTTDWALEAEDVLDFVVRGDYSAT